MQLTGKDNYRQFRDWYRAAGLHCPDFVRDPDSVNTGPWEGLVPLFYWDTRDLNRWADEGDAETIMRKINGGKNGLADRFNRLARISLVLLGYRADNVLQFQADQRLQVDGDVGLKTRAAMHTALVALTPGEAARPEVKAAPVTEERSVSCSCHAAQPRISMVEVARVITSSVIGGGASLLTAIVAEPPPDPCRVRRHCWLHLLAQER